MPNGFIIILCVMLRVYFELCARLLALCTVLCTVDSLFLSVPKYSRKNCNSDPDFVEELENEKRDRRKNL